MTAERAKGHGMGVTNARSAREGEAVVTLYARDGCHLCDEARQGILTLGDELGAVELREIDIDSDDGLHAAFLERIPVIEVSGRIVSELEPDLNAVRAALRPGLV
jgi:hypothetical protein